VHFAILAFCATLLKPAYAIIRKYKYSSAKFYEAGADDPIAIGFSFITHWMD